MCLPAPNTPVSVSCSTIYPRHVCAITFCPWTSVGRQGFWFKVPRMNFWHSAENTPACHTTQQSVHCSPAYASKNLDLDYNSLSITGSLWPGIHFLLENIHTNSCCVAYHCHCVHASRLCLTHSNVCTIEISVALPPSTSFVSTPMLELFTLQSGFSRSVQERQV
ncbi:unnamed protein product [Ectocarpus sp. 13 AM-2016]